MKIKKLEIENFRLLKNATLDMTDGLTLLVGKNNTGKTSFAVILESFLSQSSSAKFGFDDFPLCLRDQILNIAEDTNELELAIRLIVTIEYGDEDNLQNLSEFMLDLDPDRSELKILFECKIDKERLLSRAPTNAEQRNAFVRKELSKYLVTSIYAFDDEDYEGVVPYYLEKYSELEPKEFKFVKQLLNIQTIHAKRNVASSDEARESKSNPLASVALKYFQKLSEKDDEKLNDIRTRLLEADNDLNGDYTAVFENFLDQASKFLDLQGKLKVSSNIEASTVLGNSTKIIYGDDDHHLPESRNGLGYLNVLYLLLQLELKKQEFQETNADINLLIIEEPEAHTHPQMQSVFAKEIRKVICDIPRLQSVVTTHSSYIVSRSDFEDIRYLCKSADNQNVEFKNFHTELSSKYSEKKDGAKLYQFLEQYLKIQNAELFFADKAIFIEGTTERILLPLFIDKFDKNNVPSDETLEEIAPQNISVIEAGANAEAFAPFLEFVGIKALILTDIDTTASEINDKGKTVYKTSPVAVSERTDNDTIRHFLAAPEFRDAEYAKWHRKLLEGSLEQTRENILVCYQTEEHGYHARSFEDAFFNVNRQEIENKKTEINGLKNKGSIVSLDEDNIFEITENVLKKKSDFAASALFLDLTNEVQWRMPSYIEEGLKWISK